MPLEKLQEELKLWQEGKARVEKAEKQLRAVVEVQAMSVSSQKQKQKNSRMNAGIVPGSVAPSKPVFLALALLILLSVSLMVCLLLISLNGGSNIHQVSIEQTTSTEPAKSASPILTNSSSTVPQLVVHQREIHVQPVYVENTTYVIHEQIKFNVTQDAVDYMNEILRK